MLYCNVYYKILFGYSGVCKTVTARIIALYLNCSLGSTFELCGSCENCLALKNSSHPDMTEIDAASHTSLEDKITNFKTSTKIRRTCRI